MVASLQTQGQCGSALKIKASIAPIQVAMSRWDFKTRAAAAIWPGSPHSVKKNEPKQTKNPFNHAPCKPSAGTISGGSSTQISVAETKKATRR